MEYHLSFSHPSAEFVGFSCLLMKTLFIPFQKPVFFQIAGNCWSHSIPVICKHPVVVVVIRSLDVFALVLN